MYDQDLYYSLSKKQKVILLMYNKEFSLIISYFIHSESPTYIYQSLIDLFFFM